MKKKPPTPAPTPATPPSTRTATKRKGAGLPIVNDTVDARTLAAVAAVAAAKNAAHLDSADDSALSAAWPEAVLVLSDDERKQRVRRGLDSVLLDEVQPDGSRRTRGFVRVVMRVPLGHPKARVYGVFVEVDRAGYLALRKAFADKQETRVWGRLATRLPFLDDAYGTDVCVLEDGSDARARVVEVKAESLITGPVVGPRVSRS